MSAPGKPTLLNFDNQSAIAIVRNGMLHARTKHIDIRYHFIREAAESGLLSLQYCPTTEMIADILMKALPRPTLEKLRWMLGVRPV